MKARFLEVEGDPGALQLELTLDILVKEVRVGSASVYRPYLDVSGYKCLQLTKGANSAEAYCLWDRQTFVDEKYVPSRYDCSMTTANDSYWVFDVIIARNNGAIPTIATIEVGENQHCQGKPWLRTLPGVRALIESMFPVDHSLYQARMAAINSDSAIIILNIDASGLGAEFLVRSMFKPGVALNSLAKRVHAAAMEGP